MIFNSRYLEEEKNDWFINWFIHFYTNWKQSIKNTLFNV